VGATLRRFSFGGKAIPLSERRIKHEVERHSGAGRNPEQFMNSGSIDQILSSFWTPAFAGVTDM
jgi:hypothetical protein